jgi:hypothetical protein
MKIDSQSEDDNFEPSSSIIDDLSANNESNLLSIIGEFASEWPS